MPFPAALALALLASCGPREAAPEDMREAAAACGIQAFEIAATRNASQSPYTLVYVDEGDERLVYDCYAALLRSKGLRPTLARRSADLRTDIGLLFARTAEACDLPAAAMFTQEDGKITIYGGADLPERRRECATRRLTSPGRFRDIHFSNGTPPPPPTLAL